MAREPVCKDCIAEGVTTFREPAVGAAANRCTTHHRAFKKRSRSNAHARRVKNTYGITAEQYEALYVAQGGRCYICKTASGKTKKLAVDHCHETGLVRGLLCGPDNQMIGRLRELGLVNALNYLNNPPAFAVIGRIVVPDFVPPEMVAEQLPKIAPVTTFGIPSVDLGPIVESHRFIAAHKDVIGGNCATCGYSAVAPCHV